MSKSRSPSGVASLRARFEQNQQDNNTSPPSRGRSPTGSTASDASRPLSKVRTSFVAVEPSGPMASTVEPPRYGETETTKVTSSIMDVPDETTTTTNNSSNKLKRNGHACQPSTTTSISNPDKPASTVGDNDSSLLPADPKDERAISGGDALGEKTEGLGSILKGSPFEGEERRSTASEPQPLKQPSETSKHPLFDPSTNVQGPTPMSQLPKTSIPVVSTTQEPSQQPKSEAAFNEASSLNGKPKEAQTDTLEAQAKPETTSPKLVQKKAARPVAKPTSEMPSVKSPSTSRKPRDTAAPARQSSAKLASSKPTTAVKNTMKSPGAARKGIQKSSDGLNAAAKAPTKTAKTTDPTGPSAPSSPTANHTKKAVPIPPQGFTKPQLKSPNPPLRRPAAATASTAASAAKHGSEAQGPLARSPSRTSNASSIKKPRTTSLSKPLRPGGIRASLPADARPTEKSKPKPRTSVASTRGPEGSFLERMMRPTQSSAQKTHEKVETKSPPRKPASKPKRKSGESTGSTNKVEAEEPKGDSDPAVKTQPVAVSATEGVQPLSLTGFSTEKSDEVAQAEATEAVAPDPVAEG